MKIYELFSIFIIGATFGIMVRYLIGYKKRRAFLVAANILFGGVSCVINSALYGVDVFEIFSSGVGGVIGDFVYCACRFIFYAIRR